MQRSYQGHIAQVREGTETGKFCSDTTILNRQFCGISKLITEFVIYAHVASQHRDHAEFRLKAIKIPHPKEKVARWTHWCSCGKLKLLSSQQVLLLISLCMI